MGRYRAKPVVIDAFCWLPEMPPKELPDWMTEPLCLNPELFDGATGALTIRTLEGDMKANPGDYIVRGTQGELYPVKPDIFEHKYEAVKD